MTISLPHHYEQSVDVQGRVEDVFMHLDDFERLGDHMMRSSWMMAGSRMRYEFDEARGKEPGARVRLSGSFLWLKLEIEETVIERIPPVIKSWQTVGHPRMIVLDAYRMGFAAAPSDGGCRLRVFIDYATPRSGLRRWFGRIAGGSYARWCVRSMVDDAVARFGRLSEGTGRGGPADIRG
jgi:hypothetical protein